ncbi:HU family DNA-binding protein [Parabacteroides sp. FAFU027]|uniref:HU family DNA-binding protein n=1 Tax=Parabacteroides sp. FAFU027 TaxID=2922715 RepID=UPI001FAFE8B1|nr:HU family DNA-binding protein [Parabacteroides sp. FAFU027]
MNNKELIGELARRLELTQAEAQALLEKTCKIMGKRFAEMDTLSIQGFGTFEVKKKQERLTIHPVSGKRLLVPPKLVLSFLTGKAFKEKIKDLHPDE